MTTLTDIEQRLKPLKPLLAKRFNVSDLGVFGSYATNQQTQNSDVDILVEFSRPIGWEFVELKQMLEEVLGLEVDLVTRKALRPEMRDEVMKQVITL